MPKRLVRRAVRNFSTPAVRYPPDPRALFLLLMGVVSGVPLMFAHATPRSIIDQLDDPWVVGWGVALVGGSLLTLVGALRQTVNGVVAEQVGSVALGCACLVFAAAIGGYAGWSGSVVALWVVGFGVASLWRWGQLQAYLHAVEAIAQEIRDEGE